MVQNWLPRQQNITGNMYFSSRIVINSIGIYDNAYEDDSKNNYVIPELISRTNVST